MKRIFLLGIVVCMFMSCAMAQGISFESGGWAAALAKARAQKQLVYVDVYTTWCGPCHLLDKLIFPQKEVGDFYNASFVNLHVNAEEGEGIKLAKRYSVTGFPTHLFIDPITEKVAYQAMGYVNRDQFIGYGKTALEEWKDPMTWDKYVAAFPAKKRDKKFLKAWLKKAEHLNRDNTDILNAYVSLLDKQHPSDSDINFLAENIRTLDNDAVALVDMHREAIKENDGDDLAKRHERWSYGTLEKAVQNKNEALIGRIETSFQTMMPDEAAGKMFYVRKRYYYETGDSARGLQESMREADFISRKSIAEFLREDSLSIGSVREQMRWQLKEQGVKENDMEAQIAANFNANPSLRHNVSISAAGNLNNIAWIVYEHQANDTALLRRALAWSARSLALTEFSPEDWAPFADTYAHLLYRNHAQQEAIAFEQKIVDKLKAAGRPPTEVDSYASELEKMKGGTL